jgi:hypothetical protein
MIEREDNHEAAVQVGCAFRSSFCSRCTPCEVLANITAQNQNPQKLGSEGLCVRFMRIHPPHARCTGGGSLSLGLRVACRCILSVLCSMFVCGFAAPACCVLPVARAAHRTTGTVRSAYRHMPNKAGLYRHLYSHPTHPRDEPAFEC